MLQPASPDNEHVGDLLLITPFAPRRHARSMSDTVLRSAGQLTRLSSEQAIGRCANAMGDRGLGRSVSLSSPNKRRMTPERPPRPQHGLFGLTVIDGQAPTVRRPIPSARPDQPIERRKTSGAASVPTRVQPRQRF